MKNKSFQESLLEEIFAINESSFPSFSGSAISRTFQESESNLNSHKQISSIKSRRVASCVADLEQEIVQFTTKANKEKVQSKRDKENNPIGFARNKTETLEEESLRIPGNYSTIFTRRSSFEENLYDKCFLEENSKKERMNMRQKQREVMESEEYLYKPEINKVSKNIMSKICKNDLYEKNKKKREESFKRIIEESETRELKECRFTPNLEKSQKRMTRSFKADSLLTTEETNMKFSERNSVSVFDSLYMDSKNREAKMKSVQRKVDISLKKVPIINDISREITKNTNFEDRRIQYENKRLQKEVEKRTKENEQREIMHKPLINNISHMRQKDIPIGEHLYIQSKRSTNGQNTRGRSEGPKIYVNKKSEQVYEERKMLVFSQIFSLLDGDEDGCICINTIDFQALPHEIIKIIYPLIEELEVMEVELKREEFVSAISRLFETLSIHERDILLGHVGSVKQEEIHRQNLRINRKSEIINSCNQRSNMNIYDFCSIKEVEREKTLERERVEKRKRELKDCTFKPRINNYS